MVVFYKCNHYNIHMKKETILTQQQIKKIAEIANRFEEISQFEIVSESKSGIGLNMYIRFDLYNNTTLIDITDVSNW